jgi:hypothetical protein
MVAVRSLVLLALAGAQAYGDVFSFSEIAEALRIQSQIPGIDRTGMRDIVLPASKVAVMTTALLEYRKIAEENDQCLLELGTLVNHDAKWIASYLQDEAKQNLTSEQKLERRKQDIVLLKKVNASKVKVDEPKR